MIIWVILAIIALIVLWVIGTYNSLVTARNRVDEAWSDIDVQLKRRYDLIPNLVETVKGYAAHESGVFEKVTEARSQAISAHGTAGSAIAENNLTAALRSVFAVAENYPQLKANENFLRLQSDLTDTEDKIQAARRFFNGVARDFNTKIQRFPGNLLAGPMGFKTREFFEVGSDAEKEPVKVQF